MASEQPPTVDIKDWLVNQGPKFDHGLPLPVREKLGTHADLPTALPASAYRGIANGLSNSDVESEPDRF